MFLQRGSITLGEIFAQPPIWQKLISRIQEQGEELTAWFDQQAFSRIIFTACGSSFAAGLYAARILNHYGFPNAFAYPSSELFFSPQLPLKAGEKTLAVAISRSGETTETLKAARKLKEEGQCRLLFLGCKKDSPLSELADKTILCEEAMDEGVAALKSFTAHLLICELLIALWLKKTDLLEQLKKLPTAFDFKAVKDELHHMAGGKFAEVICLGCGFYQPLADDGALKVMELAATPACSYQTLEFRHGPISTINPNTLSILLLSDRFKDYELQVSREISAFKGQRAVLCEQATEQMKMATEYVFELKSGLPETVRAILYTPLIQLFAHYLSIVKGSNPDKIKRLSQVVHLKEV